MSFVAVTLLLSGTPPDIAVLEHALSRTGWDALTEASTDGYHSVELAVRSRPDVIVTDPTMPRLWGIDLIGRLRAVAPTTPIVCWASPASPEDAAELIRAGASAYLLKEDGPNEVVQALGPVMDGGGVVSPRIASQLFGRFAEGVHRERELGRALADATIKVQEVTHAKAEFLVRMDNAIERLTGLVDEILSIADLDRGTVDFSLSRADLRALVVDVCERMAKRYPLVRLERDVPDAMYAMVDPARISEAVAQLTDNACRYSPAGAEVRVRLRAQDEGVVFSVTDAGLGLSREVASLAPHAPLVRRGDVIRKERPGVGLGLHLARRLILLHGGILWADPLPAGGTRVSFCIPIYPPGAGLGGVVISRVDEHGRVISVDAAGRDLSAPPRDLREVTRVDVHDQGTATGPP